MVSFTLCSYWQNIKYYPKIYILDTTKVIKIVIDGKNFSDDENEIVALTYTFATKYKVTNIKSISDITEKKKVLTIVMYKESETSTIYLTYPDMNTFFVYHDKIYEMMEYKMNSMDLIQRIYNNYVN